MRLTHGFDPQAIDVLVSANVIDPDKVQDAVQALQALQVPAVPAAMPFVDAVGYAKFLVEVTEGYCYYSLGPNTVGGPIELAGLSRHEGFKWISRKHYYPAALNPEDSHHDH
jgi:hypothetical protein